MRIPNWTGSTFSSFDRHMLKSSKMTGGPYPAMAMMGWLKLTPTSEFFVRTTLSVFIPSVGDYVHYIAM